MPKITLLTLPDLHRTLPSGSTRVQDSYTVASHDEDGSLDVLLSHEGTEVRITLRHDESSVTVLATHPNAPGSTPLAIPDVLVTRTNRLLSEYGMGLQRNWRTKTHDLKVAQRRVLPVLNQQPLLVPLQGAVPGAQPAPPVIGSAPAAAPAAAPSAAPTPAPAPVPPAQAEPAAPASIPVPTAPQTRQQVLQGLPSAYAGKVVMSKQTRAKWQAARQAHRDGDPMVVAIVGPSGAGKTHLVHALSAEEGMEVVKFDASGVVEPGDWFGTVVLDSTGTRFVPSDLLTAITTPGKRTLLLDEMNRSMSRALNALLPLLDGSGSITIPQSGQRVRVNPEVQVVVTANIGSAFLATEPLDEAVRTRIGEWLEVDHLDAKQEEGLLLDRVPGLSTHHAKTLAALGALIRASAQSGQHPPVSTRQLLAAARLMRAGLEPGLAVEAAILDGYSSEGAGASERAKVKTHTEGMDWRTPEERAEAMREEQEKARQAAQEAREALREARAGEAPVMGAAFDPDAPCSVAGCGHDARWHGIDRTGSHVRVDGRTYCDNNDPCMGYQPSLQPVAR